MFFSKPKYHTSLIVDLGSTSIGVAIVATLIDKKINHKPRVIFTHREWTFATLKPNSELFVSTMVSLLDKALSYATEQGLPLLTQKTSRSTIDTIRCIYASPWYISLNKHITINHNKSIEFNNKMLDSILAVEQKKIQERYNELQVIDVKATSIHLNGYPTTLPFGKLAKQVRITAFVCLLQSKLVKTIESTVRRRINSHKIIHHSFSLATYSVIREFLMAENFLIIDVGGEVTEINIIKEGNPTHEITFPIGKNYILRKIGEDNRIEPEVALSEIKLNLNQTFSPERLSMTQNSLDRLKQVWKNSFINAISSMKHQFVPQHVFITCDPDVLPFFIDILTDKNLAQEIPVKTKLSVQPITADAFHSLLQVESKVRDDVFLYLAIYFIDRLKLHTQ